MPKPATTHCCCVLTLANGTAAPVAAAVADASLDKLLRTIELACEPPTIDANELTADALTDDVYED